jgi:hypothetical protein
MHLPRLSFRTSARRTIAVAAALPVLLVLAATPVAAFDPEELFELEPTPSPPPIEIVHPPRPTFPPPTPPDQPRVTGPVGLDVSWPQCDDELPESFGFAVVGVNHGRTYSENHCLEAQLEWAGRGADVYLNTGNPGPDHSRYWPVGGTDPIACELDDDDSHACAYLYGWQAAADGYARVLDAFVELDWADDDAERVPGDATWWLDVETANSWRGDGTLNVATLHGAVDFLQSMDVAEVGFYSTPLMWWRVTHGTDDFSSHPAWHAGASDHADAEERCDRIAFTGGELRMVQWVEDGLDRNFRCP